MRGESDKSFGQTMSEQETKKPIWRVLVEWGVFIGLILVFYSTDLGTAVQGRVQQAVLWTGLFRPNLELPADQQRDADLSVRLTTLEGEAFDLSAHEGKTVFINVWATWCAPCLAEMPNIHSLYEEVASDEIVFVMINVDEELQAATEYMERKGYTFPVYRLTHRLPPVYDSAVLPTTYVIAPNGKMVTKHTGMGQYDTRSFKDFLRRLGDGS